MKISVDTFMVAPEIISAAVIDQKMLEVCHRWGAILLVDDLPFLWSQLVLAAQQKQWPSIVLQHLTRPRGHGVIFFTSKGGHVNWGEGALPQIKVIAVPCDLRVHVANLWFLQGAGRDAQIALQPLFEVYVSHQAWQNESGSKVPCAGAGAWPSAYGSTDRCWHASAGGK